ncbi:beta-lactamase regulating signal transducer with metallopeptidase domain [Pelomonas saccharophila]|uniref:Beta-lactamase regulating signal transducer with metallopeptidase domain n=1 Tax=Roseateles saccharophilus TaxID=304 RepID=A0ABU1YIA9_ROSSA|nr:M56 family metallopeptidase [Roseateles saccharophilus]MDR7268587.1 beta-lactamase regulating signal transducer with metallopeptidase domain [Roseateles saccharophilus]
MNRLLEILVYQTLLFSAGVALLALLRPLLLRSLGAGATYMAWLLVPLLMASPLLPVPAAALPAPTAAPVKLVTLVDQALPALQPAQAAPSVAALAWLLAWAAGALLVAVSLFLLQRRYLTGLHRDAQGRWLAPSGASPAVVGLWPQRLVLPLDFEQRFDAPAQRLVLAHEAVHARRHDNAWNLLGALLLCLQWFNPLAWWAWRRLRGDQELACDAAVLSAEAGPAALAAYAQAMLAAHPAGRQPALASGWAARHPLVERVRMLSRHRRAPRWQHAGAMLLVLGLGGSAALLARAAQQPAPARDAKPPQGQGLIFEVSSQLGQNDWTRRTVTMPGKNVSMAGGPWGVFMDVLQPASCMRLTLHGFDDGSFRLTGQVLDETCQRVLSDWRELKVDGSLVQFVATTPQGPLQAQLSARLFDPKDARLPAQMKAELEAAQPLSPAQQALQAEQRERMAALHREQEAQDRAWRAARAAR